MNSRNEPQYILSLSYGKDSLACLVAIEQLGWLIAANRGMDYI